MQCICGFRIAGDLQILYVFSQAVCITMLILVFPLCRDLRLHKSVLAEDLLPDGAALSYVMHGKVNGYYR